jgi:hypothetical protein
MMMAGGRSRGQPLVGEDGDAQAHRQPAGQANAKRCRKRKQTACARAHHRIRVHLARAGHRRGHGPGKTRSLLGALFAGYDFSKAWMKDNKPDVIFLVYNDHATAFSLD